MNAIIKFISFFILLIVVVTLNLGVSYILPEPFNNINIIFLTLVLWLFVRSSGITVWFAFFAFFIIDLLSISPFGISLFAGTFAMLVVYWLSKFVFSSRSIFSISLLALLVVVIYRSLFIIIYSITLVFADRTVPLLQMSMTAVSEAFMTAFVVACVYLITLFRRDRKAKKMNRYGIIT